MPRWRRWKRPEIDHLFLRLLALFLAVVLWFLATDRPQQGIGTEQRNVNVDVQVESVGERLVVTEEPPNVTLTLEGPRLVLPFQTGDVRAYVDAAGLGPGRHRLAVQVIAPSGLNVRAVNPVEVDVVLEEQITRSVPVRAAVVGVSDGIAVRIDGVEPPEMMVYGIESAVVRTAYIMAQVDPALPTRRARAVPVDERGVSVAGVATEVEWVEVLFSIEPLTGPSTEPSIEPGSPAEEGAVDPPDAMIDELEG